MPDPTVTPHEPTWPEYRANMEATIEQMRNNADQLRRVAGYVRSGDHRGLDLWKAGMEDLEHPLVTMLQREIKAREEHLEALLEFRKALLPYTPGNFG